MLAAQGTLPHIEMTKHRNATQNAKRTATSSDVAARVVRLLPAWLNYSSADRAYTTLGKTRELPTKLQLRELGGSAWLLCKLPSNLFCRILAWSRGCHTRGAQEQLCKHGLAVFRPIEVLSIQKNLVARANAQREHPRRLIRCRILHFRVLLSTH